MTADGRFAFPAPQIDEDFARLGLARVAAVRRAVGPDVRIMLDLHGMMSVANAIRLGRRFAEYDIAFYEDPVETLSAEWFREIRDAVPLPLAGGDRLYTRYEVRPFVETRALDILQCDIGLSGGFTEMLRISAMAEACGVDLAPHNCAGPLNTAASLQFVAAVPNILVQEWFPYWTDERYDIVTEPLERRRHAPVVTIPDRPGLGVELNDDFLRRYGRTVVDRVGWRTVA
jgi:galactonate dehydratase